MMLALAVDCAQLSPLSRRSIATCSALQLCDSVTVTLTTVGTQVLGHQQPQHLAHRAPGSQGPQAARSNWQRNQVPVHSTQVSAALIPACAQLPGAAQDER